MTSTETRTVSLADPNLVSELANELDPAFSDAVEKAAKSYREAFNNAKRANSFNVKDRATELWQESGDDTVKEYQNMLADIERRTAELREDKAIASEFAVKASAAFVEQAKSESPVDPKEARAAIKTVSAGFLALIAMAMGGENYKTAGEQAGITFTDLPSNATASSPVDAAVTEHNRKVREWANDNGFDVSARGRISQDVYDAYNEAHK